MSPMVDQSELAFRQLCRKHNPNILCYTPMLHAKRFVADKTYRENFFQTCPSDRPLLAQFCGNEAKVVVQAAKLIQHLVDGIDLNLGCPENIAKKGNYGAFLLSDPTHIIDMVKQMVLELDVPVTCKIRLMPSGHHIPLERRGLAGTIEMCQQLEQVGCSMICVHARDRHNKGPKTHDSDWNALKTIADCLTIPVVANGNIASYQDVLNCYNQTGCAGVMSAEALLCDPTLFSKGWQRCRKETKEEKEHDIGPPHLLSTDVAMDYLDQAVEYPPPDFLKVVKPHLYRMLYSLLVMEEMGERGERGEPGKGDKEEKEFVSLEQKLQVARDLASCRAVVEECATLEATLSVDVQQSLKLGWYRRHFRRTSKKKRHGGGEGVVDHLGRKRKGNNGLTDQQLKQARKAKTRNWLNSGTRMN